MMMDGTHAVWYSHVPLQLSLISKPLHRSMNQQDMLTLERVNAVQ